VNYVLLVFAFIILTAFAAFIAYVISTLIKRKKVISTLIKKKKPISEKTIPEKDFSPISLDGLWCRNYEYSDREELEITFANNIAVFTKVNCGVWLNPKIPNILGELKFKDIIQIDNFKWSCQQRLAEPSNDLPWIKSSITMEPDNQNKIKAGSLIYTRKVK